MIVSLFGQIGFLPEKVQAQSGSTDTVKFFMETEPNNNKGQANEVFPGDIVSGTVNVGGDIHDYFKIYLEENSTLRVKISHTFEEGIYLEIYNDTAVLNKTYASFALDEAFINPDQTDHPGYYYLKVTAVMTFPGGGKYTLEIDSDYEVRYYCPSVGLWVKQEEYDALNVLTDQISIQSTTSSTGATGFDAPATLSSGASWNFSVGTFDGMGMSASVYDNINYDGTETVGTHSCYKLTERVEVNVSQNLGQVNQNVWNIVEHTYWVKTDTFALVKETENVIIRTIQDMGMGFTQTTDIVTADTYNYDPPLNWFNFPLTANKVWSQQVHVTGTFSVKMVIDDGMSGPVEVQISNMPLDFSVVKNFKVRSVSSITIGSNNYQVAAVDSINGRLNNNDWATPDFNLFGVSLFDEVQMGEPIGFTVTAGAYNDFSGTLTLTGQADAGAEVVINPPSIRGGQTATVAVFNNNLPTGTHFVTVNASDGTRSRNITFTYNVKNDPDFLIVPINPWEIISSAGVTITFAAWVEPVKGFASDISISGSVVGSTSHLTVNVLNTTVSSGQIVLIDVTAASQLQEGDYTIKVTGTSGTKTREAYFTLSYIKVPDFKIAVPDKLVVGTDNKVSFSGNLSAINGLNLAAGGFIGLNITPLVNMTVEINFGVVNAAEVNFNINVTFAEFDENKNYTLTVTAFTLGGSRADSNSMSRSKNIILTKSRQGGGGGGDDTEAPKINSISASTQTPNSTVSVNVTANVTDNVGV
ncbi:MAG: hypothetical protein QW728_07350, partial [Thermoplasmata archaeon]